MTELHAYCAESIASKRLPGPSAVVRFADSPDMLATIYDRENAVMVLDVICGDLANDDAGMCAPTQLHARRIVEFCQRAQESGMVQHLVAQCQAGVGRSVALVGALADKSGQPWKPKGTHNRKLYKMLRAELGLPTLAEPLVSICVRWKYSSDYLALFALSLRRQRYENWEAVCFTDGPRPDFQARDSRIRIIQNNEPCGHWGHPYRQAAFEACRGEWIGTNNDDNYLTPGYIEQLVQEGTDNDSLLVLCHGVHRYSGYSVCQVGDDLACWLARRELIEQCRWDDYSFSADKNYLKKLMALAGRRVSAVSKPLVVKN